MTKPTKRHVHPAKTQISLGISPVWSESLLSAWRKLGSLATHWAHSEDSDQTGQMPRLIWVFAGSTQSDQNLRWAHNHFVGFVVSRLKLFWQEIHIYLHWTNKDYHFTVNLITIAEDCRNERIIKAAIDACEEHRYMAAHSCRYKF